MTKHIGVAEVKRRFSEYLSRTHYKGERFVIERKGKPVAAIVAIEDLKRIEEAVVTQKRGLLAAVGAWSDYERLDELVDDLYVSRKKASDRHVKKLGT